MLPLLLLLLPMPLAYLRRVAGGCIRHSWFFRSTEEDAEHKTQLQRFRWRVVRKGPPV
jgi:hypothetical protein